jgi:sirohydrochlorin cobaltochelatase
MMNRQGVILYVHGARDSRWAEPFLRLRALVASKAPDCVVEVAFLEHMTPDLATAAQQLSRLGVARVRIVPMFFGRGGHLRDDFPKQLDAARAAAPALALEVTETAGESDAVLEALAEFALRAPVRTLRGS